MGHKKHRIRARNTSVELDITAFMNLMVVLVPFLLMTAVFTSISVLDLKLPTPGANNSSRDNKQKLDLNVIIQQNKMILTDQNGRIIKINSGNTEIGKIPKGSSISEMYWTGNILVNLSKQNSFYVEYINGGFKLHAIQVSNSQLVTMNYKDKKKLYNDDGVYKIKSDDQIQTELNLEYRRSHYPKISDQIGEIMKYLATKDDLPDELQELVDKIDTVKDVYPKAIEKVD